MTTVTQSNHTTDPVIDSDYAANWMNLNWTVITDQTDPLKYDILRFTDTATEGKAIEVWRFQSSTNSQQRAQLTNGQQGPQTLTRAEFWAKNCFWSNNQIYGTTAAGFSFVITRDGSLNTLTCTPAGPPPQQIGMTALATFSGGLAGFLVGVVLGVRAVPALAISGTAAVAGALFRGSSVNATQTAEVWVASEGSGNRMLPHPGPTTDPTERRAKPTALRSAGA